MAMTSNRTIVAEIEVGGKDVQAILRTHDLNIVTSDRDPCWPGPAPDDKVHKAFCIRGSNSHWVATKRDSFGISRSHRFYLEHDVSKFRRTTGNGKLTRWCPSDCKHCAYIP